MKLEFNKNFEYHLINNGFELQKSTEYYFNGNYWRCYFLRNIRIYVGKKTSKVSVAYFSKSTLGFRFEIKGCKTLNDLYRLEKLIEGNTNQK